MIARTPLAEVVKQRADEEQIRPIDSPRMGRRLHRGLHEVAVDGELMHGVALGRTAHDVPSRQQSAPEVCLVQCLPHRDSGTTGAEQ